MAAKDYQICSAIFNAYIAKVSKRNPNKMTDDRRPIEECEIMMLIDWYLDKKLEENRNTLSFDSHFREGKRIRLSFVVDEKNPIKIKIMELIDKSAVVAEIERLQDSIKATAIDNRISKEQAEAYKICVKLRSFVEDTLEVKEMDLEKELDRYTNSAEYVYNEMRDSYFLVAKHFFELGLNIQKAQKGKEA